MLITKTSLGNIEEMECGHINAIIPREVEAINLGEPIKEELMSTINPDLPPESKEKHQQVLKPFNPPVEFQSNTVPQEAYFHLPISVMNSLT